MNRTKLIIFLCYFLLILSGVATIVSIGWMLIFFGIFILPIFIVHLVAITKISEFKSLASVVLITSLLLFAFAMLRPDFGDVESHTGYSALFNLMGLMERKVEPTNTLFYGSIGTAVITLTLDIVILVKARRLKRSAGVK